MVSALRAAVLAAFFIAGTAQAQTPPPQCLGQPPVPWTVKHVSPDVTHRMCGRLGCTVGHKWHGRCTSYVASNEQWLIDAELAHCNCGAWYPGSLVRRRR